jgi:hypothetical protein
MMVESRFNNDERDDGSMYNTISNDMDNDGNFEADNDGSDEIDETIQDNTYNNEPIDHRKV